MAEDTWTYTLSFDSSSLPQLDGVLAAKEAVLQLGGVDTFATVQLNGHQILAPNNFHRCVRVSCVAAARELRGCCA